MLLLLVVVAIVVVAAVVKRCGPRFSHTTTTRIIFSLGGLCEFLPNLSLYLSPPPPPPPPPLLPHFLVAFRRVVTPELVPVTVNLTRSKKKEDFGLVLGYQLYVREIVPNR